MSKNFPQLLLKNPEIFSLKTENLELKLLKKEDVKERFEILKNFPEITKFLMFEPPKKIEETMSHFQNYLKGFEKSKKISWSIFYQKELIGTISLESFIWDFGGWTLNKAEIGYWLSPDFHGKGFMTESSKAILNIAFKILELNKVVAGCTSQNIASSLVLEKSGFQFIGEDKHHFKRHGKWWNHKNYEILKSDWENSQKKPKEKYIHERDICLIDLNPTKGIEMQKIRPCIVLKKFSKTHFVILPLSSNPKNKKISFKVKDNGYAVVSQIRVVDASRFIFRKGRVSVQKFLKLKKFVIEVLLPLPRKPSGHNE